MKSLAAAVMISLTLLLAGCQGGADTAKSDLSGSPYELLWRLVMGNESGRMMLSAPSSGVRQVTSEGMPEGAAMKLTEIRTCYFRLDLPAFAAGSEGLQYMIDFSRGANWRLAFSEDFPADNGFRILIVRGGEDISVVRDDGSTFPAQEYIVGWTGEIDDYEQDLVKMRQSCARAS